RHILRHVVTERYTEYADIVGTTIAGPQHRAGRDLIGDSEARRKVLERSIHVAVHADAIFAGDQNLAGGQALEASLIFVVHILREINLPAQSVIQSQLRRDAPGVLGIGEKAVLAIGGIG